MLAKDIVDLNMYGEVITCIQFKLLIRFKLLACSSMWMYKDTHTATYVAMQS